jgi:hypothetical protein
MDLGLKAKKSSLAEWHGILTAQLRNFSLPRARKSACFPAMPRRSRRIAVIGQGS